jgi:2-polyprenyl-6-methoxyphenol hydroxylase-like FAD-dependent oxidoreductase
MNISMLDMFSLSWKINLVEKGMADPSILLPTYQHERKGVAEELIRFDAEYSRLFSGRSPKATQLTTDVEKASQDGTVDAQKFIETFRKNAVRTTLFSSSPKLNSLPSFPSSSPQAAVPSILPMF